MDVSPNSIEYLILEGAAEMAGIDLETGEIMYTFTEKLESINPKLYKEINNYIYGSVMSLWTKGYLEIDLFKEEPVVKITDKAYNEDSRQALSTVEKNVLDNILRMFNEDSAI